MPAEKACWYALRTRSNHENIVTARLESRGLVAFLPAVDVASQRRDRRIILRRPIFPGYLFVRSTLCRNERLEIMQAPGAMTLVSFGAGPVVVPDWQIASIQVLLASRNPLEVLNKLVAGRRVRVEAGVLAGMEGVVQTASNGGLWLMISIDILGRSVAVKLPSEDVQPVLNSP